MVPWNSEEDRLARVAGRRFGYGSCTARLRRVVLGGLAFAILAPMVPAQEKDLPESQPLAILGGQPIGEDELPASEQAQLLRMMEQVYSVRLRALHAVLDKKLVEAEAKKKGVTVDELFRLEVSSKVPDPTEEQIKANYESRPELRSQPYDAVKEKIKAGLKGVATQKAQMTYVQGLMQEAMNNGSLELLISPPKIELTVDPSRLRGDPKAPVTIIEFSDFSCPFCRKAEASVNEVLAKYPGKVQLSYRDFPLRQLHPNAQLAAEASRCAGEQGKYWEYHDLLFANPDKQDHNGLLAGAHSLKLDDQKFDACLTSGRSAGKVESDTQMGGRAGMVGTPGFFINGTFLSGAQPPAVFEKIIDAKLAAAGKEHPAH